MESITQITEDSIKRMIREGDDHDTIMEKMASVADNNGHNEDALFRMADKVIAAFGHEQYHLTDLGNAERLIDSQRGELRYNYSRKLWLHWNGRYWEWGNEGYVLAIAADVVLGLYREIAATPDKDERTLRTKHAQHSENESRLRAMVALAQSIPGVSIKVERLDLNQYYLNVRNGTIDLRSGELKPHDKRNFITSYIDIDYIPDAQSPLWERTLNTIIDCEAKRRYVQRALGYSCTANQDEQVTFFTYGAGGNGKTTLLGAVIDCLGSDYATEIEPVVFMVKNNESAGPNEGVARLYRKRLAISTEIEDGQKLSVGLIKRMTGGEKLHHEKKFEHGFEFTPTHKLWLSGNHKPIITDTTYSIWRRVKFIDFPTTIPEEQRIKNLRTMLHQEEHKQAILAWLVAGAVDWAKNGLSEPEEITDATSRYREEMDLLFDYLSEKCVIRSSEVVFVSELYRSYKAWCEVNDTTPLGKNHFGRKLDEKGFTRSPGTGHKTVWRGLRLKTDDEIGNLGNLGTNFQQSFLHEEITKKLSEKQLYKLPALPNEQTPDYPHQPCLSCGGTDFWLSQDNRWVCCKCHPEPGTRETML